VPFDDDALLQMNRYGLGRERSLEAFEAMSGVRFAAREVTEEGLSGNQRPEFFNDFAQSAALKLLAGLV
jgi:hypothetical protein